MGKYGTNREGFGAFEGGVNADKGAPLLSTNSDGATSLLMGAPLIREIQAGVANGDFAITPDDASLTITSTNPLPYWTFTDVNSAGAITCAIVADSSNASGNVLRWSVAGATTTGKSATLTRYVSVPGSRNREFVFIPEMTLLAATASTVINSTIGFTWYKSDGVTTTGTGNTSSTANTFTVIGAGPTTITAVTSAVNTSAPSDAAFMLITITVATTGTVSAGTKTLDLAEVRIASGQSDVYVAENTTPGTYGPSRFRQANGTLTLSPNLGGTGAFAVSGNQTVSGALDVTGVLSDTVSANNKTVITGSSTQSTGSAAGDNVLQTFVTSDSNARFKLEQNGVMSWGSGSSGVDTNLYRNSANELKTDDDLTVAGALSVDGSTVLGNSTAADTLRIFTIASATTTNSQPLRVVSNVSHPIGVLWQVFRDSSSSLKYKTDVEDLPDSLAILDATPVTYLDKASIGDPNAIRQVGFIAEQMATVPELSVYVGMGEDGKPDSIDYGKLVVPIISALRAQQKRIADLEERLAALES
jgi:hypothetical protein